MTIQAVVRSILLVGAFSFFEMGEARELTNLRHDRCPRLDLSEELIGVREFVEINSSIRSLVLGKLFYQQTSEYCVPTNDRYLVAKFDGGYVQIQAKFKGHTPNGRLEKFHDGHVLLVYYVAGASQYVLEIFDVSSTEIVRMPDARFVSNIRSITMVDRKIKVRNQITMDNGERTVTSETYLYVGKSRGFRKAAYDGVSKKSLGSE